MHGHDNDNLMVSMRCFWQSGRQTGSQKTQDWTPPAKSPARCITAIFGCWTAWSEVLSGLGRVAPVQCLALSLAPTLDAFTPFRCIYWTEGSDGSSRTACACSHNTRKSMTIMWAECDTNSTTLKTKMLWHMLQDKQFEYWIIAKGKVYTGPAVWRDPVVQPWISRFGRPCRGRRTEHGCITAFQILESLVMFCCHASTFQSEK